MGNYWRSILTVRDDPAWPIGWLPSERFSFLFVFRSSFRQKRLGRYESERQKKEEEEEMSIYLYIRKERVEVGGKTNSSTLGVQWREKVFRRRLQSSVGRRQVWILFKIPPSSSAAAPKLSELYLYLYCVARLSSTDRQGRRRIASRRARRRAKVFPHRDMPHWLFIFFSFSYCSLPFSSIYSECEDEAKLFSFSFPLSP